MNDSDLKRKDASPKRAEPNEAFRQAMIGVETRCRDLATAIENHDFEAVEYIAREAMNMWLTGRVACRRFIERAKESSPYADAARSLLEENYMTLLELFACAAKTIEVPRMQRVLHELRGTLMAAMARPLLDATAARAVADQPKHE
jgi:hypothetical protein